MHAVFEKRLGHREVADGGYHDAHRVDLAEQLPGIGVGRAMIFLGDRRGGIHVEIGHADQLHIRHMGIDACMKFAQVADSDYPDA